MRYSAHQLAIFARNYARHVALFHKEDAFLLSYQLSLFGYILYIDEDGSLFFDYPDSYHFGWVSFILSYLFKVAWAVSRLIVPVLGRVERSRVSVWGLLDRKSVV